MFQGGNRQEITEKEGLIKALDKEYWKSIELPNGVVIDIAKDGSMTSIEILKASKLFYGYARKVIKNVKSVSEFA